jgi:hypothetical protein
MCGYVRKKISRLYTSRNSTALLIEDTSVMLFACCMLTAQRSPFLRLAVSRCTCVLLQCHDVTILIASSGNRIFRLPGMRHTYQHGGHRTFKICCLQMKKHDNPNTVFEIVFSTRVITLLLILSMPRNKMALIQTWQTIILQTVA